MSREGSRRVTSTARATALVALLALRVGAHSNAMPDLGPNVRIFEPTMSAASIQATLDSIFASQESSEFGPNRYALLFKPGTYAVDARVGFYTQVAGLGLSPDQVVIDGAVRADARWRNGNATLNFWRAVENLSINPAKGFDQW